MLNLVNNSYEKGTISILFSVKSFLPDYERYISIPTIPEPIITNIGLGLNFLMIIKLIVKSPSAMGFIYERVNVATLSPQSARIAIPNPAEAIRDTTAGLRPARIP